MFVRLQDFSSIPCRHQRKFQMLVPRDGPYGWIFLPCTASCRHCKTIHSHIFSQSIYLSASTSQLSCSFSDCLTFSDCWLRVPWSLFSCINQADYWEDCVTWLRGSWRYCSSNPWVTCLRRRWWLDSWVPLPFTHILIDYPSFVMFKLELVSEGRGGIHWYHGVYSRAGRVGPRRVHEGGTERRLHYDSNVPMVSSSLCCRKGLHDFV